MGRELVQGFRNIDQINNPNLEVGAGRKTFHFHFKGFWLAPLSCLQGAHASLAEYLPDNSWVSVHNSRTARSAYQFSKSAGSVFFT